MRLPHPFDCAQGRLFAIFKGWVSCATPLLVKADVGKVADIQRMFETIKSQFGGLDIFVSNARATLATGFYAEPMEIRGDSHYAPQRTYSTSLCWIKRVGECGMFSGAWTTKHGLSNFFRKFCCLPIYSSLNWARAGPPVLPCSIQPRWYTSANL
jgi:NAD(P)-dependent dehydrogenase (short-subunit alcohol dehydrogenase family)